MRQRVEAYQNNDYKIDINYILIDVEDRLQKIFLRAITMV